jgi:hypothetical protein
MPPPFYFIKENEDMRKKEEKINDVDAQLRLAQIMNDTPKKIKLGERTFEIRALKPGTQHLIAEEAAKIAKAGESFTDIIQQFAKQVPSVIRCITLAVLNDKQKIYGKEYQDMYDYIEFETNQREWLMVLVEVLQMLDLNFFFQTTSQIDLFREITLTSRKKSEASLSKQQAR